MLNNHDGIWIEMHIYDDRLIKMQCLTFCFFLLFPEAQFIPNKQLQPKETQIYIKLVKYAMQALDIYQVQPKIFTTVYHMCFLFVQWL